MVRDTQHRGAEQAAGRCTMRTTPSHTTGFAAIRAVVVAFLPASEDDEPVPTGHGDPRRAQCRTGEHAWLAPELSLRSARTGFRSEFCRYCAAHQRIVPAQDQAWFGQVGSAGRL